MANLRKVDVLMEQAKELMDKAIAVGNAKKAAEYMTESADVLHECLIEIRKELEYLDIISKEGLELPPEILAQILAERAEQKEQ